MWQNNEAQDILKSVEDLLQEQEQLLGSFDNSVVATAGNVVEVPVKKEPDNYIKELSEMFADDKEFTDLLSSLEKSKPKKTLIEQPSIEKIVEFPMTNNEEEDDKNNLFKEEEVLVNREVELSNITEKQLRALSRKHLMLMILDLQEDLNRTREEKEDMLIAYKAGLSKRIQKD